MSRAPGAGEHIPVGLLHIIAASQGKKKKVFVHAIHKVYWTQQWNEAVWNVEKAMHKYLIPKVVFKRLKEQLFLQLFHHSSKLHCS